MKAKLPSIIFMLVLTLSAIVKSPRRRRAYHKSGIPSAKRRLDAALDYQ